MQRGLLQTNKIRFLFTVLNFTFDGKAVHITEGVAEYTATFIKWTKELGIARCLCSDGKERSIPSFCLRGSLGILPIQPESPSHTMS